MNIMREGRWKLLSMAALVAVMSGLAFAASFAARDTDLKKALQTASLGLVFGSLLGGIVKLLLDDFDRGRQQRAEQAQFCLNVFSDLKSVYDQTERAKILISGNQSAKTYYEQMCELIEARVKLLNVVRAVNIQSIAQTGGEWGALDTHVTQMDHYLESLIRDYQQYYKTISEAQCTYEAKMKAYVEQLAKGQVSTQSQPDNQPWAVICELASMQDFLDLKHIGVEKTNYHQQFVAPLDQASKLLIHQLRLVLG